MSRATAYPQLGRSLFAYPDSDPAPFRLEALMTATLPTEALVCELIEARCRRLMAERASLSDTWTHRAERRDLAEQINASLERYNWLTLGR